MADGGSQELNLTLQPKQTLAFTSDATEQFYGGGTYGGKSHLMRVAAIIWCSEIPGLQVYIFRREFPDLYKNHMEGPTGFPVLLTPWIMAGWCKVNYGKNYIEFWNGSKIHLCHCQYEHSKFDYDGAEIHVLMIDELTHFTETMYRFLRGRVRLGSGIVIPAKYKGQFPRILCASNPGNVGHNWVKAFFISIQMPFAKMRMPPEEGGFLRQFIPALAVDNPAGLANDPLYMENQAGLGEAALVKARRDGDWNIVAGGAFDDVWTPRIIVPRFPVPITWALDRSFDWGSTKPFSVLWFAECDGTEAFFSRDPHIPANQRKLCPPRGSLVVIHEWYGAKSPNVGLKMGARAIARGIKEREAELFKNRWISIAVKAGPADNQIDAGVDPDSPSLKKQMEGEGVHWLESNKSPGSRKIGFDTLREMMLETDKSIPEQPCLYVMEHCRQAISHWPVLPRDPDNLDDVDSSAEDHDYDALRYRVLKIKRRSSQSALTI